MTADTLTLERRDQGVVIVWIDDPDESVNTLKQGFIEEFDRLLGELEGMGDLKALVFASKKPDSFVAGADLKMLKAVKTADDGRKLSQTAQGLYNRLAALKVPKVGAIHGPCLGGGMELALAFDARVVSDDPKTQLGQPEVKLGLLPGGGATQRLPRLIKVQDALDMMLTGKSWSAQQARRKGLAHEVVPKSILIEAAVELALELARQPEGEQEESLTDRLKKLFQADEIQELALAGNPIGRKVLFDKAREKVLSKTRGNYPAPERILEVVRIGLEEGMEKGFQAEAAAFGELVVSQEARELINIFFATNTLKKETGVDDSSVKPRPVNKVAVLGGGLMGAGIGYVTALKAEKPVRIKDKDDAGVGHGLAYVHGRLDERVKRHKLTPLQHRQVMARVTGTIDYSGFADVDVVIEAVFEDLDLKQKMIKEVEAAGKPDLIFASNTSAIPIGKIAEASSHPETVIGMHYFSPVEKMPLAEITITEQTAPWVTATCVALGKQQGKTVIVVHDGPGFYTSRILAPYLIEALRLVSEGVPVEAIDNALKDFGFPVGPIALLDEVGLDVSEKVMKTIFQAFGERLDSPPNIDKLLDDKRFGRKNKRGFYRYDGDKNKEVDETVYQVLGVEPTATLEAKEIVDRCVLLMVNEAALCFGEGILRSARDGDVGAVFGLGFPPFRGGPFRYVDAAGARDMVGELERYAEKHGKRFKPAPVLVELADRGGRFYGEDAPKPTDPL